MGRQRRQILALQGGDDDRGGGDGRGGGGNDGADSSFVVAAETAGQAVRREFRAAVHAVEAADYLARAPRRPTRNGNGGGGDGGDDVEQLALKANWALQTAVQERARATQALTALRLKAAATTAQKQDLAARLANQTAAMATLELQQKAATELATKFAAAWKACRGPIAAHRSPKAVVGPNACLFGLRKKRWKCRRRLTHCCFPSILSTG